VDEPKREILGDEPSGNGDAPVIEPPEKKTKIDMESLPTRKYLEHTVVPILLQGLSSLTKER